MPLPKLIILNGIVAVLIGAFAFVWPAAFGGLYGAPAVFEVYALVRFLGVAFVLFGGVLMWAGNLADGLPARSLARTLALAHGLATAVLFIQQTQIWLSTAGWLTVGVFAAFTILYAAALMRAQTPAVAAAG